MFVLEIIVVDFAGHREFEQERGAESGEAVVFARLDCGVQAGTFYNSERRQSFYVAYMLEHEFGPASLGVLAGAVTGYDRGAVSPLAGVGAGINLSDKLTLRAFYGPGGKERDIHTVHAALEWRF